MQLAHNEEVDQSIASAISSDPTEDTAQTIVREEMAPEARRALLRHYTDELLSHAAILATLGLVVFGGLRAWEAVGWDCLNFPTVVMAIAAGLWQVFRFIFYALMAGHIMHREPIPEDRLRHYMNQDRYLGPIEVYPSTLVGSEPTKIFALHMSALLFNRRRHRFHYYLAHPLSVETRQQKPHYPFLYIVLFFFAGGLFILGLSDWRPALGLPEWSGPRHVLGIPLPFSPGEVFLLVIWFGTVLASLFWLWMHRARPRHE